MSRPNERENKQVEKNMVTQQKKAKSFLKDDQRTQGLQADGSCSQYPTSEKENVRGDTKSLRISMLRTRASALITQSKYEEAATFLEELAQLQKRKKLDTSLMMIECYLQLGKEKKGEALIEDIKQTLMTSSLSADDVKNLAHDMVTNSYHIRAIILLGVAIDMYKARATSQTDVIQAIASNVYAALYDAIKAMVETGGRSKIIGLDYGIPYFDGIIGDLRKHPDSERRALLEALCLHLIGYIYTVSKDNQKSITTNSRGVKILEETFGPRACDFKFYINMLYNLGQAYDNQNQTSEAQNYYIRSIRASANSTEGTRWSKATLERFLESIN